MPEPLPPFQVGTLVPSMRDFLQAVTTRRTGLALVPHLALEDVGREALRDAESGVAALAMSEPGVPMAEAAEATKLPMLCLRLVQTKDDYLAARAYGADAVVLPPSLDDRAHADLATGGRSTRMVAFDLVNNEVEAGIAAGRRARGLIVRAPDVAGVRRIAMKLPASLTLVAWPQRAAEEDLRALVGAVDAAIVGVDVYGVTGFERLVSELNP